MQKLVQGLNVGRACRYIGIGRQAYYKRQQSEARQNAREIKVCALVNHLRLRQPRLGTRKPQHVLRTPLAEAGIQAGRDRLLDIPRATRLLVVPQRAYHETTRSHHRFRRHPNLLKGGPDQAVPTGPEQVWVADITYLSTAQRCVYLSLVIGAYLCKIVGYRVHGSLHAESVAQALKMALKARHTRQPLVHHSDRGIQYCSAEYQRIHQRHGITCSMVDGYGRCQNALVKRVNSILKGELLLKRPAGLEQVTRMVAQAVHVYNHERPHLALKYKTPDTVHQALAD